LFLCLSRLKQHNCSRNILMQAKPVFFKVPQGFLKNTLF
jgi:hypothetical protein